MPLIARLSILVSAVLTIGVLPAVVHHAADAAPAAQPFTALSGFHPTGDRIRVQPRSYAASRVDVDALRAVLSRATATEPVTLAIPGPDGKTVRFRVERTSLMQSKLAAAHPEIVTFAGRGVDDSSTIALDLTPMGFHASVRPAGVQGAWYVDPAYNGRGTTTHLSYYGAALPAAAQRRTEGETRAIRSTVHAKLASDLAAGSLVERRFFRLALTSDPSYANYFGTANVLAEKVTLINRVNQIYNDDMAINLRLVNASDSLNLDTAAKATGANGPCGQAGCFTAGQIAGCGVATLGRNRTVLGQLVGASNYDIGHLALGVNGGGIAYLGVTGGDYKGGGCTGLPDPIGDFFAIDYVAHEMGHQFGGNHTFNGALGACGGNISEASVEPGSGSSVMAYAGICGQDDLQPHTDPYFSHLTIGEVKALAESEPYRNTEAQTVSLRGFDTDGEQITLDFPGSAGPITLTRGTSYTAAAIDTAVETLTGLDVSIARWGFDEVVQGPGTPDNAGFQVIFNDTPTVFEADDTDVDLPSLTVSSPSAGVSGFVGETAQGGLSLNAGSTVVTTANNSPVVTAPADKTLPLRTPFALTASGTDANGDSLTYLWEQADFGDEDGTRLADNAKTTGPLFRVFGTAAEVSDEGTLESPSPGENIADGNPTRVFPDMAQVLAGNTNADGDGTCTPPADDAVALTPAQRECFSEFLPVPGYIGSVGSPTAAMHFRVTARDGFLNGGGSSFDDVVLTIDPTKGPFEVTSQATPGGSAQAGTPLTVAWKPNHTETLAPTVKVTMSTNGGATFDQVLAASTPNDGSEALVLPNVPTTHARIKIEAVGNYFFDVNDAEFTVTAADTAAPDTSITSGPSEDSVVLSKSVHLAYTSSEAGSTFACLVDGLATPCGTAAVTLMGLKAGTHTFSVAARDAAGNIDASAAERTFTVPVDDPKLKHKGDWKIKKTSGAFGGDFSKSSTKDDKLTYEVHDVTRIVLVVGTGKKFGPVKVYLGKKFLKTIRLKGKQHGMLIRTAAVFNGPRSGKLKIVVDKDKPVRIEGVALVDG